MQSPLEFVRAQGWDFTIDNNYIHVFKCPLCGGNRTFSIHFVTGKWSCSNCNKEGNLYQLKVELGIVIPLDLESGLSTLPELEERYKIKISESYSKLVGNPRLVDVLCDWRGFTKEAIDYFELGYTTDEEGTGYLVVPHKFKGKYYNAKFRSWVGFEKSFQRIPNKPTILFNADCLLDSPNTVIITEGEFDCILLHSLGLTNVVAVTAGAKSELSSVSQIFIDLFSNVEKIIIAFDGDKAGRDGARRVAKRLGVHRSYLVNLPDGFDITDYYKSFGKEALFKLIDNAVPVSVGDIESFSDIVDRLSNTVLSDDYLTTGYKSLDNVINGYFPAGMLITLTGLAKSGKTTFATSLAFNFAVNHGPALIFCLEMDKPAVVNILRSQLLLSSRKHSAVESGIVAYNISNYPLYHAFMSDATPDVAIETIREAFYRYGIRFVVFDNINYLVRNVDNKASKLADVIKDFSILAKKLGLIIVLIAQPKKISRRKGAETEMTGSDIAWTSAYETDSDLVLIINRPRIYKTTMTFSPFFKLVVDSSRYASGGVVYYMLDNYSASIFEMGSNDASKIEEFFQKVYKLDKDENKN